MKALKIVGLTLLTLVALLIAVLGYTWYRLSHQKDTHNLQELVDKACNDYLTEGNSPGLCVGIVKGGKLYIKGYGKSDNNIGGPPTAETIFEIGSITKVFTASIAQLLVDQEEIEWTDDIRKFLPEQMSIPDSESITLHHLATHTSGFPRLPDTWLSENVMTNDCDPYSTLTAQHLHNYLATSNDRIPPSKASYNYSNIGMGLLGHVLEWKTGRSYEDLLQQMICQPLHLTSTSLEVIDTSLFATGHDESGNQTCHWHFPIIPGAGAIRSNMSDMIRFLQANMNGSHPLSSSFKKLHQKKEKATGGAIGHGWHIDDLSPRIFGEKEIIWHNGGTGGFSSYIGFIPGKAGVVLLANQYNPKLDALAMKLLGRAAKVSLK